MIPSPESSAEGAFDGLPYQTNIGASEAPPHNPNDVQAQSATREDVPGSARRTKHMACIVCRRRKLKCDGRKPRCATCSRLGHRCTYDEVRRKSGPKRGYVKHLEARLSQVETLLQAQDGSDGVPPASSMAPYPTPSSSFHHLPAFSSPYISTQATPRTISGPGVTDSQLNDAAANAGFAMPGNFTWDLVSLGLEEPLPTQDIIDDMNHIYFAVVHQSIPIIHRPRYFALMDAAPNMRPPVCLRYAMWTHVALMSPKYRELGPHFYARARKYAERDELKGFGENIVTLGHSQAWSLIANYEFKMVYMVRAWMSSGRAARLVLLMGLNRQDAVASQVRDILPPARAWFEVEERRRSFWIAFIQDRCSSTGMGWPMTIHERDIQTNLPASEEAFINGTSETTPSLETAMTPAGASNLSPFGSVVLVASFNGRILLHIHRPESSANHNSASARFWNRHRALDDLLSKITAEMSPQLQPTTTLDDPNFVLSYVNLHAAMIYLHQAAIAKAEKSRMPQHIIDESNIRCRIAAAQIVSLMHHARHLDPCDMISFIGFCLYIASKAFVQYLKEHEGNTAAISSLRFLVATLHRLKAKYSLAEPFLVQIEADLKVHRVELPSGESGLDTMSFHVSSLTFLYPRFDRYKDNHSEIPYASITPAPEEILPVRIRKASCNSTDSSGMVMGVSSAAPECVNAEQDQGIYRRRQDGHIPQVQEEPVPTQATSWAQDPNRAAGIPLQPARPHNIEPPLRYHDPQRPPPTELVPLSTSAAYLEASSMPDDSLSAGHTRPRPFPTLSDPAPPQDDLRPRNGPSMAVPPQPTAPGFANEQAGDPTSIPGFANSHPAGGLSRPSDFFASPVVGNDAGGQTGLEPDPAQAHLASTRNRFPNWQPAYGQNGDNWRY